MSDPTTNISLLYDDSAFVETMRAPERAPREGPAGLMGRQVAGKEFLDAYLTHGSWERLVAVVKERAGAESLVGLCRDHPSSRAKKRRLQIVEEREFHARFFPTPPAEVLHLPAPLDARFAWARQHGGPGAFALCGVTHTLCSTAAVAQLCNLVTAPFERFDALICTSRAVLDMVRAVTGTYAEYLRERHGGTPAVRSRLEVIPLGVNEQRFCPPTPQERAARRRAFHIADDEVAVLFVGRLSHHAKAHPAPMYRGLCRAARRTGQKVHLLLCGWAAHPAVEQAFVAGARVLAPNVRLTVLDGTDPAIRFAIWHAADVFASLADNIQETFGLVILEAMASGLPVVASDWNGYRDLVVDGTTGLLVPTRMLPGATADTTSRLLLGEINYEQFLAQCSQATVVDVPATADAFVRLLSDANLRRRMGEAGRQRLLDRFTWGRVIRAYECLWREQEAERREWTKGRTTCAVPTPACYPSPEKSFEGYPTSWLRDDDVFQCVEGAKGELEILLRMPLTSHAPESRCLDIVLLRAVLDAAAGGCPSGVLDRVFAKAGVGVGPARATLAWLVKYGLLELDARS